MDERSDLVEDLLSKRERINEAAFRHRELRDRLNDQTREHARRRDELNAQVRGLVGEANAHKARRDALNAQVKEGKVRRDELNRAAHEKAEALHALRREQGVKGGAPLPKLRAELARLEYDHQTRVLTPRQEKDLIDLIAAKQREIQAREAAYEGDETLREAVEAMRAAKAAAEEQHQAVTTLAMEAQAAHEAMVRLFAQADTLRKQADAAQADFVRSKAEADRVHREYVELINQIRDLERVVHALREREAPGQPTPRHVAEADQIFDRFRKGEKLSTEDLMALQKAGRL